MIREPNAEAWRAQVDAIIKRYRNGYAGFAGMRRADAIAELKKLGLSEGDAARWLKEPLPPLSGG